MMKILTQIKYNKYEKASQLKLTSFVEITKFDNPI